MFSFLAWYGGLRVRDYPGGDLGPGAEAELVQDAADVAVDGALGDEQPRADLLVGQAVGDQPGDVRLARAERPGRGRSRVGRARARRARARRLPGGGLAEGQVERGVAAQVPARLGLGLVPG